MSTLERAMPTILRDEGRFVNDINDPGGATNYGISLRFLLKAGVIYGDLNDDGKVDINDIREMTVPQATILYDKFFWSPNHYSLIYDQAVATKLLSLAVNMGDSMAHKCLQRALRSVTGKIILDDGILGAITMKEAFEANPITLLPAMKSEAAGYYRSIKFVNPAQDASKYLKGWLNRAYSDMC